MSATENDSRRGKRRAASRWIALTTVLAVFVAGAVWWLMSDNRTHVTAY